MNRRLGIVALSLLFLTQGPTTQAQDPAPENESAAKSRLKVGDPAPPLKVTRWLKGGPIASLEPGKVYVVEPWASWCAPCVAAMPHLTKLQAGYKDKDVVVIGLNVLERDPAAAEPFVRKTGDRMNYAVAADDLSAGPPGVLVDTWLRAAGRNGLPWTILIDRRGRIAWMGFPTMMDRPLAALAEDRFDPAEQAKFEAQLDTLFDEYAAASKAKDDAKSLAVLGRLIALNPAMAPQYSTTRLAVLLRTGDYPAANAQARALIGDQAGDDPTLPATIASILLNAPDATKIDTAVAVTLARTAYDLNDKDAWVYAALLARAHAANHDYAKAVDLQTQALTHVPENAREREEHTLADYKQKAAENAGK